MKSAIMVPDGTDINKLLLPNRYYLASNCTFTNLPADMVGKSCILDVSCARHDYTNLFRELTSINSTTMLVMKQAVISDNDSPWPRGNFTFGSWFKFEGTKI